MRRFASCAILGEKFSPLTNTMVSASSTFRREGLATLSSESLRATLREVQDGAPLSPEIACQLLRCDDDILPDLLAAARALKEKYRAGVITYSRKVFLPLTNLCRDYCGYCTFRRDPDDPGAHT